MSERDSEIRSISHFEPLAQLAIQRYSISKDGVDPLEPADARVVDFVVSIMHLYDKPEAFRGADFETYSLNTILEYLERTHCFYEDVMLPKMELAIDALCRNYPENGVCPVLSAFFNTYRQELTGHIRHEETVLFPYARRLSHGGRVKDYSTTDFEHAHSHEVEEALQRILHILEECHPDVCESFAYRSFRHLLYQFSLDLKIHHLIEEGVFVVKLRVLERNNGGMPYQ